MCADILSSQGSIQIQMKRLSVVFISPCYSVIKSETHKTLLIKSFTPAQICHQGLLPPLPFHPSLTHPSPAQIWPCYSLSLSSFGLWLPAFTAFAHSHFRSLRFRLLFLLVFFVIPPFFGSLNPETRKLELASKRRGCYENGSKARAFFRSLRASGD